MGRPRSPQVCCSSICLREIQPEEKAVALSVVACTLGMGKRRTAKAQWMYLCPQCAGRTATGKEPSKTAPFDQAIFRTLLDLLGAQPDVMEAAWEQLKNRRQELLYKSALTEGKMEVLPPMKRLQEAS